MYNCQINFVSFKWRISKCWFWRHAIQWRSHQYQSRAITWINQFHLHWVEYALRDLNYDQSDYNALQCYNFSYNPIQLLIVLLSFTSFAVSPDEPADRLSVTLTLLLTAVAFKFVVSQSLPTISYLTLLVSINPPWSYYRLVKKEYHIILLPNQRECTVTCLPQILNATNYGVSDFQVHVQHNGML